MKKKVERNMLDLKILPLSFTPGTACLHKALKCNIFQRLVKSDENTQSDEQKSLHCIMFYGCTEVYLHVSYTLELSNFRRI